MTQPTSSGSRTGKKSPLKMLLAEIAALTALARPRVLAAMVNGADPSLLIAPKQLGQSLGREVFPDEAADSLMQAIVCALPLARAFPERVSRAIHWLLPSAAAWELVIWREVLSLVEPRAEPRFLQRDELAGLLAAIQALRASGGLENHEPLIHLFEPYYQQHAAEKRKRQGVFYTPAPLVRLIVSQVDFQLQNEFGLPLGLADTTTWAPFAIRHPSLAIPDGVSPDQPVVQILDPAVGTGAFLLEVVRRIHARFIAQPAGDWNEYVARQLLPRLSGIEILPAPAALAKLHLALALAATGFDFRRSGKVQIRLGSALANRDASHGGEFPTVILGNPPFSALSENRGEWITGLVRGSEQQPGYIRATGESLAERKTWLHDDYVKFLRLAQWWMERAGCGIIGFVTNHGYLDNITFRLMRKELWRAMPRITVLDLHGNRKKGETGPEGARDENVFGLDQGVALGLFRRFPGCLPRVEHRELWGGRADKLASLAALADEPLAASVIQPAATHYLFIPARRAAAAEYAAAWRLPDLMPVHTSAPVTARDRFVVADNAAELQQRMEEFRDLSIPDDEIRRRYFVRTRSARHAPGDSRGWKLAAARRIMAAESDWKKYIRRCLYRPFDWRFVFWHPALVDWPRTEVTRHLVDSTAGSTPNLALITRRQQLPTRPCSFFWIADTLALDGVIRSDNRGSESLFPLYLIDAQTPAGRRRAANFAERFIQLCTERMQLDWRAEGRGDLQTTFGPEDLLEYIYALFHSPSYRRRYAEELRNDFPRVLLPKSAALFAALAAWGGQLAACHLSDLAPPLAPGDSPPLEQLRSFRVGGHAVFQRAGKRRPDLAHAPPQEQPLFGPIAATLRLMDKVDAAIHQHGGWPAAFV